jgi:hypothetical protein
MHYQVKTAGVFFLQANNCETEMDIVGKREMLVGAGPI